MLSAGLSAVPPPTVSLARKLSICLQMGCFYHSSQTDSEWNNDALLTKQFLCVKPSFLRFFFPPVPSGSALCGVLHFVVSFTF